MIFTAGGRRSRTHPHAEPRHRTRTRTPRNEDPMPEFMMGWPFMIGMIVALLLLIGVYLFLKNNRKDED
jgi:hypothetical protein